MRHALFFLGRGEFSPGESPNNCWSILSHTVKQSEFREATCAGERAMSETAERRRERHLEAARGYLMLDMPDHALRELKAVVEPGEGAFDVSSLRGEALRQKRDFEAALQAFQQAHRLQPDELSVIIGVAWCLKRTSPDYA